MENELLFLNNEEVEASLNFSEIITAVHNAYLWKAQEKSTEFPLVTHVFDHTDADMDIKSGYVGPLQAFGMKQIAWFGGNAQKGIDDLTSFIALFSAETGQPIAVMNGAAITGYRTAAAAVIGAKALARKDASKLLIVGCGHLCSYVAAAFACLMPQVREIGINDPLNKGNAQRKVQSITQEMQVLGQTPHNINFSAEETLKDAVANYDIIVTITPATEPLIKDEWVSYGTHFSCLGADMHGKQEIDPKIVARGRAFCDDAAQSFDVGEFEIGLNSGVFTKDHIAGEIGQVLAGSIEGRQDDGQITIFDSTGIAGQDLASAISVLKAAKAKGLGTKLAW